jgi:hypothetical protein
MAGLPKTELSTAYASAWHKKHPNVVAPPPSLETEINRAFENKFQRQYLLEILENGEPSPPSQLAMALGLVTHKTFTRWLFRPGDLPVLEGIPERQLPGSEGCTSFLNKKVSGR